MTMKELVGSGEKIGLVTLPILVIGVALNLAFPSFFSVGGPPDALRVVSIAVLVVGVVVWAWSAALILTRVPRKQLITSGPFALVRHPLYTGVALLVLPWIGFLLNTWLGLLIGLVVYGASRWFAPREEDTLAQAFGPAWDAYRTGVKIPWL
jgi:protein-S-isoprenylcysteine O-methyltransferase Ste14